MLQSYITDYRLAYNFFERKDKKTCRKSDTDTKSATTDVLCRNVEREKQVHFSSPMLYAALKTCLSDSTAVHMKSVRVTGCMLHYLYYIYMYSTIYVLSKLAF